MRGGAKKKDGEPATEENRSERQTWRIIRGGAVSPCRRAVFAACLSPLYLEHQPHQQENKTKQKKRKLYPPFPVQNQTCSRGTWKEAKNVAQSSLSNFQVYYFLPLFQPLLVVLATSKSAFIQHLIQWRCEDEVGQRGRKTSNCLKHTLSITRCFFGTNHHSVILGLS